MGVYNLKFNLLKYTFGVQTDNFLRFLVHQFETEADNHVSTTSIKSIFFKGS